MRCKEKSNPGCMIKMNQSLVPTAEMPFVSENQLRFRSAYQSDGIDGLAAELYRFADEYLKNEKDRIDGKNTISMY